MSIRFLASVIPAAVAIGCVINMACSGHPAGHEIGYGVGREADRAGDNQAAGPEDMKQEAPKDGMIYVWPLPHHGHQSLVVLNVVDGNTVDAAYLVPVRIRLKGITAPPLDEKGGKEARQAVDKLVGGQLRAAQLWGVGESGVIADFWLPAEKEGDKGQWASEALLKLGVVKQAK